MNFEFVIQHDSEIIRLKKEQDKYDFLCSKLCEDLRKGIVKKEEFERLHSEFKQKAERMENARKKQEEQVKEMFQKGVVSAKRLKSIQECAELREIDRYLLCSMIKKISVYENQRIEIEFYYADQFRIIEEANRN